MDARAHFCKYFRFDARPAMRARFAERSGMTNAKKPKWSAGDKVFGRRVTAGFLRDATSQSTCSVFAAANYRPEARY